MRGLIRVSRPRMPTGGNEGDRPAGRDPWLCSLYGLSPAKSPLNVRRIVLIEFGKF
jgi:hypothetical protein